MGWGSVINHCSEITTRNTRSNRHWYDWCHGSVKTDWLTATLWKLCPMNQNCLFVSYYYCHYSIFSSNYIARTTGYVLCRRGGLLMASPSGCCCSSRLLLVCLLLTYKCFCVVSCCLFNNTFTIIIGVPSRHSPPQRRPSHSHRPLSGSLWSILTVRVEWPLCTTSSPVPTDNERGT